MAGRDMNRQASPPRVMNTAPISTSAPGSTNTAKGLARSKRIRLGSPGRCQMLCTVPGRYASARAAALDRFDDPLP